MNELVLSKDLNVITAEIHSYKNIAGQSIFEIGRRLKHVKENDMAHGEWGEYCSEEVGFTPQYANKFITIFDEFEKTNRIPSFDLGVKALYEIATLPEPERIKEHVTSKGETKTPDEMTVRELRELKKQLKERDEQLSKRDEENDLLQSKLEDAENREPETIEIEKEVVPEDYESVKRSLEDMERIQAGREEHVKKLQQEIADMRAKRSDMDKKSKEYDELNDAINSMNQKLTDGQMKIKNQKMIYDLVKESKNLIREVAPLSYILDTIDIRDNKYAKEEIDGIIKSLDEILKRLKNNTQTEIIM